MNVVHPNFLCVTLVHPNPICWVNVCHANFACMNVVHPKRVKVHLAVASGYLQDFLRFQTLDCPDRGPWCHPAPERDVLHAGPALVLSVGAIRETNQYTLLQEIQAWNIPRPSEGGITHLPFGSGGFPNGHVTEHPLGLGHRFGYVTRGTYSYPHPGHFTVGSVTMLTQPPAA